MLEILREADAKKKAKGGRKSKLSIENQLLMALEFDAAVFEEQLQHLEVRLLTLS